MQGIKLSESQLKILNNSSNGTSMFILPIINSNLKLLIDEETKNKFISKFSPIKINEEFFIKEDFMIHDTSDGVFNIYYKSYKPNFVNSHNWQSASEMIKEQSRYILKCLNIDVIRIQDKILKGMQIFLDLSVLNGIRQNHMKEDVKI